MLLNRVFLFLIIINSYIFASELDSLQFDEAFKREDYSTRNAEKVNWRPADEKEMFPKYLKFSVGVTLYIVAMMNISGMINAE